MAVLRSASGFVLLGSVVLYWAGQVLSAAKWQLLLRAQGASLSLFECCRLYLVGMFCNLWLPTNIGGDAVRAVLAAPKCGGAAIAVSSIFVERITGFLALLLIGVVALLADLLSPRKGYMAKGNMAMSPFMIIIQAMVVALLFAALFWMSRRAAKRLSHKAPHNNLARKWAALHRALDEYGSRDRLGVLATSMLLSLVFQASQVVLNLVLARAVGLQLPPLVMWWLVPVLALASLVPLGIGGLGVREVAAIKLLSASGISAETVLAWSLLWQATVWLASLPGALWWKSRSDARVLANKPE
jgi:hypothetical protein